MCVQHVCMGICVCVCMRANPDYYRIGNEGESLTDEHMAYRRTDPRGMSLAFSMSACHCEERSVKTRESLGPEMYA